MVCCRCKSGGRGFSLIEVIFGISLLTVLVGAALYLTLANSKERKLVEAKAALFSTERNIYEALKADLDRAIRVTGRTSVTRFPGIKGRETPRLDSENYDPLRLLIQENGHFAWNHVTKPQVNATTGTFDVDLLESVPPHQTEARYFYTLIQQSDFFILSSIERSNVFRKTSPAQTIGNRLRVSFDPVGFQTGDYFEASPLLLSGVREVVYEVNAQRQLVRKDRLAETHDYNVRVIAENILRFHLNYSFQEKNYQELAINPLPPGRNAPLSYRPGTPHSPSLTWSDVEGIRLDLSVETSGPTDILIASAESSGFSLQNKNLSHERIFWFSPAHYTLQTMKTETSGTQACDLQDPSIRCRAEFSHCFTSQQRDSAEWAGFADPTGPYCQCMNNPTDSRPLDELNYWVAADRTRLDQCVRAINPCASNWELLNRHPGMQLVCGCLTNAERYYDQSPRLDEQLGYEVFTYHADRMPQTPQDLTNHSAPLGNDPGDPGNEFRCEWYQNVIQNPFGNFSCDTSARFYFGSIHNQTFADATPITAWADECGCLTHDRDQNGQATNRRIIPAARNLLRLCGITELNGPPACLNTIQGQEAVTFTDPDGIATPINNNIYRVSGIPQDQALSETDALLCRAIESARIENDGTFPTINFTPGMGGAFEEAWDFRGPRNQGPQPPADPAPFGVAPHLTFGSSRGRLGTVKVVDPLPGNQWSAPREINGDFAEAFCQDGRHGLSCAALSHPSLNLPQGWPESGETPNPTWATTHSGYCRSDVPANHPDIDQVRRRITGTSQFGVLPPNCGGPQGGGSL